LLAFVLTDDGIMAIEDRIGGKVVEFQPMSGEEIERTVQSLLHQEARIAAVVERLSEKTDRLADGLIGLTGIVGHITGHLEDVTDHLGQVTDRLGDVTDRLAELAAAQERTDQQIRNMQEMFERHLRDDHGRRPN
jgi:methyl-accepting chemotaxis protein